MLNSISYLLRKQSLSYLEETMFLEKGILKSFLHT